MKKINFPIRYIPKNISRKDKQKQIKMLIKSKKMYKNHKYYTCKNISSYTPFLISNAEFLQSD